MDFPYPWPHMTSVEGDGIMGGGMEYPMMTLIGGYNGMADTALYSVHTHELAHMWFPMIVGVDERRFAWIDEGTTSFNENQSEKEFYPGRNWDADDRDAYAGFARTGFEGEIIRWSDLQSPMAYGVASYPKPAALLASLRAILGEDVFLEAFRTFIDDWAYKHPQPWDLFNAFERVAGQDLDWFWRTWYYETWTLDQAVGSVTSEGDRTTITVEDHGWAPMPVTLTITLRNGDVMHAEIPVEHWLDGNWSAEVTVTTPSPVTMVEIDADGHFPDINRRNNVWERT
jgi:aminopeptidase N